MGRPLAYPKEHRMTYDAFTSWEAERLRNAEERDQWDEEDEP